MKTPDALNELHSLSEVVTDLRMRVDAADRRIQNLAVRMTGASDDVKPPEPVLPRPPAAAPKAPTPVPVREEKETLPSWDAPRPVRPMPPVPDPPVRQTAPAPRKRTDGESLELKLGRVWLVRLGVLILLTGLVFLGNHAYHQFIGQLGAAGRVSLIFLAAAVLGGIGVWVSRKRTEMRAFGNVLIGGGLAVGYYATFAAHFVKPLQVLASPIAGGVALLAYALAVLWLADRIRSRVLATVVIALAFYTSALNPIAAFSLYGNVVLSALAVILLWRRGWQPLGFVALAGAYGALAFWRFQQTGSLTAIAAPDAGAFALGIAFPAVYWVLFLVAAMLRPETNSRHWGVALSTLNNGAFFGLCAPLIAGTYPGALWISTVGFGAVLLGVFGWMRRTGHFSEAHECAWLVQALAVIALGFALRFSGYELAVVMALQTGVLVTLGHVRYRGILLGFAVAWAVVAAGLVAKSMLELDSVPATSFLVAGLLVGAGALHAWKGRKAASDTELDWFLRFAFFGLGAALFCAQVFISVTPPWDLLILLMVSIPVVIVGTKLVLPEVRVLGNAMAGLTYVVWVARPEFHDQISSAAAVVLLAVVHAVMTRPISCLSVPRPACAAHGLAVLAVTWITLAARLEGEWLALGMAAAASIALCAGLALRLPPLAVGSGLLWVSGAATLALAIFGGASWAWPTVTWALLVAPSGILFVAARGGLAPIRKPLDVVRRAVHAVASPLAMLALMSYVPERALFLTFTGIGVILVIAGLRRASVRLETAVHGLVYLGISGAVFLAQLAIFGVRWTDLIGFSAWIALQQIVRSSEVGASRSWRSWQWVGGVLATGGLWLVIVAKSEAWGVPFTVATSVVAFLVLALGFLRRDAIYRLLGLGIIGCAVAHVFLVDVWALETLLRIVAFLVLGVVLISLGFLYNRYSNHLKTWLR